VGDCSDIFISFNYFNTPFINKDFAILFLQNAIAVKAFPGYECRKPVSLPFPAFCIAAINLQPQQIYCTTETGAAEIAWPPGPGIADSRVGDLGALAPGRVRAEIAK
jgi:hypothetical protein